MFKKWKPAVRIFIWELGGFLVAFIFSLIIYLTYKMATHTLQDKFSLSHDVFFLKFLAPVLVGTGSILGSILGHKENVPDIRAQTFGTIAFVILNYALFWPGPNENYLLLFFEATLLNCAFLIFFLRNINRARKK